MKTKNERVEEMKSKLVGLITIGLIAGAVISQAQETKYATSATAVDPAVTFGPQIGRTYVTAISASTDTPNGVAKFYVKSGKYAPTETPGATATNILITNTGIVVTNSDKVVYVHANGTVAYRTISLASATNVILSSALVVTGASGDYLYEVTQGGQMAVGTSATGPGTNTVVNVSGDALFVTPADSPLYVTLDSDTNTTLQVTVK